MSAEKLHIKERVVHTLIVGSGAAAYNAANRLWELGVRDLLMVTENRLAGTSRNTGSDKQTYYKLSLGGPHPDSVPAMAQALFDGYCMDGDIALAEAANSARSFLNLVERGVPFPFDEDGAFFGYQTDHDQSERASSVGPLTSKAMTESLEATAFSRGIDQLNKCLVVKLLVNNGQVYGALCFLHNQADAADANGAFLLIRCKNIVYATGGPAGIYKNVVYPAGHHGMSGIALEAGVKGRNLTEWQYGLASLRPRWNVSGTYMQALPRFISTDQSGQDAREFLCDYFPDRKSELTNVFLKGYQWPFDVRKAIEGSSIIDLLVYHETAHKNRRVFLDYRTNPADEAISAEDLSPESHTYLARNEAIFGTPIIRLRHMNEPAYQFYLSKGVDLEQEPLEIALCAQHNNGGLAVDNWWQTNISGLYACGEVAGTHGIYRPGGSALNSGQVGSLRAAQAIAQANRKADSTAIPELPAELVQEVNTLVSKASGYLAEHENSRKLWEELSAEFYTVAGPVRDGEGIRTFLVKARNLLTDFDDLVRVSSLSTLFYLYHFRDTLLSQIYYSEAMLDYINKGGHSRGSALYLDPDGRIDHEKIWEGLRFELDSGELNEQIQELQEDGNQLKVAWRQRRPLVLDHPAFETAWKSFRKKYGLE